MQNQIRITIWKSFLCGCFWIVFKWHQFVSCFFLSSFIRWFISTRRIALDSEVVRIKNITTKWQTRVLYIYIHVRCCIIPDKKERISEQHFQYMKSSTRSQWKKMETEVFFSLLYFVLWFFRLLFFYFGMNHAMVQIFSDTKKVLFLFFTIPFRFF